MAESQDSKPLWLVKLRSVTYDGGSKTGGGVIVDLELGLIVTARHVLETVGENSREKVVETAYIQLDDKGTEYEADVLYTFLDKKVDIAFLLLNPRYKNDLQEYVHQQSHIPRDLSISDQPIAEKISVQCYGYPGGNHYVYTAGKVIIADDDFQKSIDIQLNSELEGEIDGFSGGIVTRSSSGTKQLLGIITHADNSSYQVTRCISAKPCYTFSPDLEKIRRGIRPLAELSFPSTRESLLPINSTQHPVILGRALTAVCSLSALLVILYAYATNRDLPFSFRQPFSHQVSPRVELLPERRPLPPEIAAPDSYLKTEPSQVTISVALQPSPTFKRERLRPRMAAPDVATSATEAVADACSRLPSLEFSKHDILVSFALLDDSGETRETMEVAQQQVTELTKQVERSLQALFKDGLFRISGRPFRSRHVLVETLFGRDQRELCELKKSGDRPPLFFVIGELRLKTSPSTTLACTDYPISASLTAILNVMRADDSTRQFMVQKHSGEQEFHIASRCASTVDGAIRKARENLASKLQEFHIAQRILEHIRELNRSF